MKLVSFLMNLPHSTSQTLSVELKNGNKVTGQLLSCNPEMNLSLKNIQISGPNKEKEHLSYISIRGNQIRQIVLPEDLNIDSVLAKSVTKIKGSGAGPRIAPKRPIRPAKRRGI